MLQPITFGVAYGCNLMQVKQLVEEAVNNLHLEGIDPEKPVISLVYELGDSSVNFKLLAWCDVLKRGVVVSEVLYTVYDTLNANGIEIPFPQQDVHIRN